MKLPALAIAGSLFAVSTAVSQAPQPDGAGLERGTLPASWAESPDACASRQSDFRLHEYNPDFYILRQSGCTNYEKPFLYLIFGDGQALLVDTGAKGAKVSDAISAALKRWADAHGKPVPRLIGAHSHAHGDHIAGDSALAAMQGVTVVGGWWSSRASGAPHTFSAHTSRRRERRSSTTRSGRGSNPTSMRSS